MENFAAFNAAYAEALGDHRPARSTVAVAGLPAGFLVEVEAWAYKPNDVHRTSLQFTWCWSRRWYR